MAQGKRVYGITTPFVDIFPEPVTKTSAPTTSDKNFENGQVWIYKNGDTRVSYMYGGLDSSGDAVWILAGPGSSEVDTLTGDSGGAISPSSGNITLAGGTNITSAGSGSTITFNLDAAITLATSVTSALYTTAAASDLLITAATGQDIVLKMGDNGGTNKVSFTDSDDVEVFAVDSNGAITFSNFSNTGTFTTAGGTASINASSNFNTVINSGTSTGTVTIGNAAAGAITVDSAAGISLDGATASNFTVTGAADLTIASTAGSIPITAGEAAADAIVLNASDSAGGVQIQAGTGGILVGNQADCTTISVGDIAPTASRTITVGGGTVVTASVTDTIDIAPDGATTNADSVKTVNINTGTVATGQLLTNIASGGVTSGTHTTSIASGAITNGTVTLNMLSGNVAAGTVVTNLLTGTGTKTLNIGNSTGTTMNLDGPFLVNDSINSNTSINTGNSTGTVSIGNAAAGALTMDTAAGISLDAATASNFTVTGAADLTLTSTAGSIPITAGEAASDAIALQAASGGLAINTGLAIIADAAGNIELNSSAGQILIGNDAVSQNMSIGTAGARTVTVGSTTGASALVLQSGTGKITMTGTVQQIDANFLCPAGICIPAFTMDSVAATAANTGGAPTGTDTDVNLVSMQGGNIFQAYVIGTQTILQPIMGANGLIISGDETAAEGYEYNLPYLQYTIGTSAAFMFELGLYINDRDGGAPYVFGFRKTEANNATFGNYTDYATIGMIAASSTTNVVTATELNSGGQTVTTSTDAWGSDAATHTLAVLVDASGNVTYTFDGVALGGAAAFQFDSTDVVIPFIRITHSANPTDVAITSMKIGFQA